MTIHKSIKWLSSNSWTVYFFFLLCITKRVLGFNLDVEFATFFKAPQLGSRFGYDVDLYGGSSKSWIVVGAPNANTNGDVYRCIYNPAVNVTSCDLVPISKVSSTNEVKQRLGSTVSIGKNRNLLTCAPNYAHTSKGVRATFYDLIGVCYLVQDFAKPKTSTYRYTPCLDQYGSHYGDSHSFCQAGFSASFTKDRQKILLGAVGSYYNQGSLILIDRIYQNISSLTVTTYTDEFKVTKPPDFPGELADYYRQTYDVNYMGYSVAIGATGSNLPLIVTSAPRRFGYNLLGAVTIYDDKLKTALVNLTGEQIGEYFGEGLAVVDVNGDNLDDVIVGSPLYTDFSRKEPEIGRIYIYYQQAGVNQSNTDRHILFSDPTIINGNVSMGRFGQAITSLTDINNDGYQDILVSAPYETSNTNDADENQYGALYVFNGGAEGIHENPSQVIHGNDLEKTINFDPTQHIRGLGYSMKGGKDMDGNGYPDIVVGAYLSDQAIVIRSRPVVKLVATSEILPRKVDLETLSCTLPDKTKAACYEVKTCFSYTGKNLPSSVRISYSYDVDSGMREEDKRSYLLDLEYRNITLVAGNEKCVTETVYVKRTLRDKLSPIEVEVSYWLRETHQPVEPVLDTLLGTSVTTTAEIFKDCGADEVCIPDLKVASEVSPTTAYVGDYTEIVMTATASNDAENAYQALLLVRYPLTFASFVGLDGDQGALPSCRDINQTVICDIGNPLKTNAHVTVKLRFGINDLLGDVPTLSFQTLANCTNENSFVSNTVTSQIDIKVYAKMQIYNVSEPSTISLNKVSNKTNSKLVSHSYEITNLGPSTIAEARISLLWPIFYNGKYLFPLYDVISQGDIECDYTAIINASQASEEGILVPEDKSPAIEGGQLENFFNCRTVSDSCFEMKCKVGRMEPKTDVLITMKGNLYLNSFLESDLDSVVTSSLVFDILKYPYVVTDDSPNLLSEVSTYAVYPRVETQSLPWWIVAVAVAAGVLFLLIIILVMWKCGFFKRKRTTQTEEDRIQQEKLCEEPDPMQKEVEERMK
ncbi:unnamed protein product [Clavelina lepadiformis]|uniref:Uncharacterized protein n=1 Tax=Clavelina lepadiformis TaxID=159417 RepID=A0ABP0FYQ8_CLALP